MLQGRHTRQRETSPGWSQDGQDPLDVKQNEFFREACVRDELRDVDFMAKDSKKFVDSGEGNAVFDYDTASDTFKPGTSAGAPPQGNDAKCGFACHTQAKARDYVFTHYGKR